MKRLAVYLAGIALAGCVTTSEMPLAPNVVRLDTQASGLVFVGAAPAVTMQKAASATISRGYTHFRLEQASTSRGRELVGMQTSGNAYGNATIYGNRAYGNVSGTSYSTPVYAPTSNVGVTVIMFHANEAGASGAWDAADVLAKKGKV